MGESYWIKEIKLWLLDHATKHDMNDVVKYILRDKDITEHLYEKFAGPNGKKEEAHPTYLFILLLEHLKKSLQNFQPPDASHNFSWDKEALSLVIDILDGTYKENRFVNFFTFMKLLKLLKLMVMFRMIYENVDSHDVCRALNLHFPHWTSEAKQNLIETYGSESECLADDVRATCSDTRKFILKLLLNTIWKKRYLATNYGADVQKMVQKAMPLLDEVISGVKNLTGPSTIEQIISCAEYDISSSNDPAVQIILEYLKPDMTEDDFLELLKILEFPDCQDDNLNISFGSPIEEMQNLFNVDDGKNLPEVNVVGDCTPPSDDDCNMAPGTEQKQYGPLGLGPPSAKKVTMEEASEVQAVQEHMELVMDSEDEEQP